MSNTTETGVEKGVGGDTGGTTRDEHAMRPVAIAFAVANAAILGVFALLVVSGWLDVGTTEAVAAVSS